MRKRWTSAFTKASAHKRNNEPGWVRSPLWLFLNSPIVVLLIGAVIIGGIGTVLAAGQKCISEAEATVERHRRLVVEILDRRSAFANAVIVSKSAKELRLWGNQNSTSSRYTYLEFQGRTIQDLEDEEIQLGFKLNIPTTPALESRVRFSRQALRETIDENMSVWKGLEQQDLTSLTDKNLPALRQAAREQQNWAFVARTKMLGLRGVPACSILAVTSRILTGYPTYVATLQPWHI